MSDRNPVDLLAEEYCDLRRRGEAPSVETFAQQHPEFADEIRDMLPALLVVEELRSEKPEAIDEIRSKTPEIPEYRILGELGRGGMGIVYEAQHLALGRTVALKVLPTGLASQERTVERFQQEARAAASMHHSNIVPLFDIGSTEKYNYYAMQLINGDGLDRVIAAVRTARGGGSRNSSGPPPISEQLALALTNGGNGRAISRKPSAPATQDSSGDRLVDTRPLSTSATSSFSSSLGANTYARNVARIGAAVADALEHAHRRGIIHRDIKPSNLLLDTDGTPWVTDFGLAKAESVELTQSGNILGTLRYMSPERFSGPCDARGDIYGLGATLYEMLTCQPIFSTSDHLSLIDSIKTKVPPGVREFDPSIPRDLETIVSCATAKEPKNRYASARLFAEDLQLFLDGRPINARRVGPIERLILWSKQNRLLAALAASLLFALVGITISSVVGANIYRNLAREAGSAKELAEREEANAHQAAKRSADVLRMITAAFHKTNPNEGGSVKMLAIDVLHNARGSLADSDMDAITKADLLYILMTTMSDIGETVAAIDAGEECLEIRLDQLGEEHPDTLATIHFLGLYYGWTPNHAKALPLKERAYRGRLKVLGPDHAETLKSANSLAYCYFGLRRMEDALILQEETLIRQRDAHGINKFTLKMMNVMALIYKSTKNYEKGVALEEETVDLQSQLVGEDAPDTLATMHNLAISYYEMRRYDDSIKLFKEVLAKRSARIGPFHMHTLATLISLCRAISAQGNHAEGIAQLAKYIEFSKRKLGEDHDTTIYLQEILDSMRESNSN